MRARVLVSFAWLAAACGGGTFSIDNPMSAEASIERVQSLDPSPYGVDAHLAGDAMLESLASIGIRWFRVDCDWWFLEPERGRYNWADLDRVVDEVKSLGGSVYCSIGYTPQWASGSSNVAKPPQNPQDFVDFVRVLTRRYAGRMDCLGIWNEPNLTQFYDGSRSAFVSSLFTPGVQAIREEAPDMAICGPEVTGSKSNSLDWLRDILNAAGSYIDVVTHHQYDGKDTVGGRVDEWRKVHDFLVSRGHGNKPLWMSETGWDRPRFSASTQSSNLRGMMERMRGTPWWSKTFWYDSHGAGWGLLAADTEPNPGEPTPSFAAYRDAIAADPSKGGGGSGGGGSGGGTPSPVDDAALVASDVPASAECGARVSASVTMRNTGTTVWRNAESIKLGVRDSQLAFASGDPNRRWLADDVAVAPGASLRFAFEVDVPASTGGYTLALQMVREGVRFFGAPVVRVIQVSCGGTPPPGTPPPTDPPPPSDSGATSDDPILAPNERLAPGDSVLSSDRRFRLVYQGDGNLVLYMNDATALWASGTNGTSPGFAAMQGDGNLVVYDASSRPVWATNTSGHEAAWLAVQDDGNTVIYTPQGAPLWATNTSGH